RSFQFAFSDTTTPVHFTVRVDGDPDIWTIGAIESTMIVTPAGETLQEAEFRVTAKKPGRDKLHISVEQVETGATVQHVWLSITAGGDHYCRNCFAHIRPTAKYCTQCGSPNARLNQNTPNALNKHHTRTLTTEHLSPNASVLSASDTTHDVSTTLNTASS